ncbi:SpoIIE family protein phosphatase [Streptomyces luomodiensis]|uniref:SpoIIE family protein phosphatase n=1 Tax=Streptomyces luomodiensis TaxID=3026192 RepID=A0ABY9UTG0_9ACTN|nr:SpoIIE family protein phosphatase [Streptomyces sp. SCA4-21]WNE95837.1 SpoIIE family protein phosphatase [Streptomyces sp. SCA4-21]
MGALFPLSRESVSRTTLPGSVGAPGAARAFVRTALTEQSTTETYTPIAVDERSVDDAVLLVSELVTNAVLHAGTRVEVICRVQPGGADDEAGAAGPGETPGPDDVPKRPGIVVEVVDLHPASTVYGGPETQRRGRGRGLQLIGALAESWGVTYHRTRKAVWFRLDAERAGPAYDTVPTSALGRELRFAETLAPIPPREQRDPTTEWVDRGGPSFLAEASELLTGQLDENMVAALAGQLLVPRLADWCAVWLVTEGGRLQLARVWHGDERRIDALRVALERYPPPTGLGSAGGTPWPWPGVADSHGTGGSAVCFPLIAHGRSHGALLLGRAGVPRLSEGVVRLSEDVARRVAQAVATARQYTRQATISRALQRRQLPMSLAHIPGVDTAIVYEPHGEGQTVGGDFYDLFPMSSRRWCFLLGDVQGSDPEAMSVTGLARHLVRLLAREGHGVESVLSRLNQALVEEETEAAEIGGEQARPRFLSLLYGELEPDPEGGGARCTLASAGHPLPLRLTTDGAVAPAATPQMLLGIDEDPGFHADTVNLAPGETLLCVTDGVTERRNGTRQLDDDDGLSEILRGCVGLGAKAVAERVRRATHDFAAEPVDDDLAVLVLEAVPPVSHRGCRDGAGLGRDRDGTV